jgi:hypothetical protein
MGPKYWKVLISTYSSTCGAGNHGDAQINHIKDSCFLIACQSWILLAHTPGSMPHALR